MRRWKVEVEAAKIHSIDVLKKYARRYELKCSKKQEILNHKINFGYYVIESIAYSDLYDKTYY